VKVSDFDYELPEELIAQQPLARRDESRMLVVDRKGGEIHHARFFNFPDHFAPGDVLVFNETRVIPARAWGHKGGKRIEFLFVHQHSGESWEVLCRPAKHVRVGDFIVFSPGLKGEVTEVGPEGSRIIHFKGTDVLAELKKTGFAPLPPYIKRKKEHALLETLGRRGIRITPICLDVGLATFQPVRADRVENHAMLEERYSITQESAGVINTALGGGRPVTAVGTTSVRTLESAAPEGRVRTGQDSTRLFIYPDFGGYDLIMQAYREAVRERYRFFSYGDCMLIK
jgi:S-adenosylmethionine:tRNA ribosyltransferase-isomerase